MDKPTREQIGPPRPDDMGELARLTAIELRKRGIWADEVYFGCVDVARVSPDNKWAARWAQYALFTSDFDNLTPSECADVIQREEAAKAAEWAGDK